MNDFSYSFRQRHDVPWVHAEREKREDNAPETGRNPRGEGEELPGKRGERVGETGTRRPPCIITPPAVRTNGGRRSF